MMLSQEKKKDLYGDIFIHFSMNSSMIFPDAVEVDCGKVFDIGKIQYDTYTETRFIFGSEDVIKTVIPRNNLKLPKDWKSVVVYSPRIKMTPKTLSGLHAACEARPELAKKVFKGEPTNVPECFLDLEGKPFHSGKADLFKKLLPGSDAAPDKFDGVILDISVTIQGLAAVLPTPQLTYTKFAIQVLRYSERLAVQLQAKRLDLVFDTYLENSIKSATREGRGMAGEIVFDKDDKISSDFKAFLQNNENKKHFNDLIQKTASDPLFWQWQGEVVSTHGKKVWTRSDGTKEFGTWINELHEEADNRILLHVKDALEAGLESIVIKTADTDVVVLLLAYHMQFREYSSSCNIWVEFGRSGHKRIINLSKAVDDLGESFCLAVPFFFAFCGCDSTTSFYKKPSTFMFRAWMTHPEEIDLTSTFQQLSWQPSEATVIAAIPLIERFINHCYGFENLESVDEVRFQLFNTTVTDNLRELPPCQASLKLHILRSAFQSGWVWGNTVSQQEMPPVTQWGWHLDQNDKLRILWYPDNPIPEGLNLLDVIKSCKCRLALCNNCTCARMKAACLKLCNCKQQCEKS